jgi:hypothetical protein
VLLKDGLLRKHGTLTHSRRVETKRETLVDFFEDVYASPAQFLMSTTAIEAGATPTTR